MSRPTEHPDPTGGAPASSSSSRRADEEREGGDVPLASYAAIGDGRTVALVARDGAVDWMPTPALNTPPVFAALLDADRGGRLTLRPRDPFTTQREYVEGTNVLRTTFRTEGGSVVVTDALVTGVAGRLPWCELARRVEGIDGSVDMVWSVEPGTVFTEARAERLASSHGPILRVGDIDIAVVGLEHGPLAAQEPAAPGSAGSASSSTAGTVGASFQGRLTTSPGSRHLLAVCGTQGEPVPLPDPQLVDRGIDRTIENWQRWSREFSYEGPWADVVQRSALALKTLIFSPSGAIAAAATTSLPEDLRGGKNWDYRLAWVRDLSYTVAALVRFGLREETHAAVSWILRALRENGSEPHVLFSLEGELCNPVEEVEAPGWRGIGPVVTGNRGEDQLQLGIYADVVDIVRLLAQNGHVLDAQTRELVGRFADGACERWAEEDSGMWELPEPAHYVTSKIGCWRALDSAIDLADSGELTPSDEQLDTWRRNRRLIGEWIEDKGWDERRGAYVMAPGDDRLDASILLHGGTPFGDPARFAATVDAIRAELMVGPLVYRYTGVEEEEGAFVACSFWLVESLAQMGRVGEARALMDQAVRLPNDVGMLSEMISTRTGEFLGNLPQALSHLGLVNAAIAVERAERAESVERAGD